MAPFITEGFRAIGNLPELFDIELPKIKKKDDRYNYNYHHYGNSITFYPWMKKYFQIVPCLDPSSPRYLPADWKLCCRNFPTLKSFSRSFPWLMDR